MSYKPSQQFEDAAKYLSSASSLSRVGNDIKLELYGTYKFVTISPSPTTSRPSLIDFTGRAKWDAWKKAGQTWGDDRSAAEMRYIEIASSLGWQSSTKKEESATKELSAEELLEQPDDIEQGATEGTSFSANVSTMGQQGEISDSTDEETVHGLAIFGDPKKLSAFIASRSGVDLNARDEYGYTPLHLACDRGNETIVEILLKKGADRDIEDPDGLTALELAQETGRTSIVALFE